MRSLISAFVLELLKLRRTLALWMAVLAPLVVVLMQTLISIRRGLVNASGLDPWWSFMVNVFSMWAVFMQPLLAALVVALVYHAEHANHGWHRMYTLPIPRWTVPAAKIGLVFALLILSTIVLVGGSLLGAKIAEIVRHEKVLPALIPWGQILYATLRLTLASLLVVAIQNAVSLRWSSISVSLGVGIAGAFIAISGAGWEHGYLFPWLMAMCTLHGPAETGTYAIALGSGLGLVLTAATLVYAARRDPGLYQ